MGRKIKTLEEALRKLEWHKKELERVKTKAKTKEEELLSYLEKLAEEGTDELGLANQVEALTKANEEFAEEIQKQASLALVQDILVQKLKSELDTVNNIKEELIKEPLNKEIASLKANLTLAREGNVALQNQLDIRARELYESTKACEDYKSSIALLRQKIESRDNEIVILREERKQFQEKASKKSFFDWLRNQ